MAGYTADAYNASAPTAEDVAGHADKEFRALKERLNYQLGGVQYGDIGRKLGVAEGAIATHGQSISSLGTQLSTTDGIAKAAKLASETNAGAISTLNSGFNSLSSTVSSQGSTLTSHSQAINNLNIGINQLGTSLGQTNSTVSSLSSTVTSQGTTISQQGTTINTLSARPTIYSGTTPPGTIGKDGDIYVQYV